MPKKRGKRDTKRDEGAESQSAAAAGAPPARSRSAPKRTSREARDFAPQSGGAKSSAATGAASERLTPESAGPTRHDQGSESPKPVKAGSVATAPSVPVSAAVTALLGYMWNRYTAIVGAIATVAVLLTNIDTIQSHVRRWRGLGPPIPQATAVTIDRMVASLRAASDTVRRDTLIAIDRILDDQPILVPRARERLIGFVKEQSYRKDLNDRCSSAQPIQPAISRALAISLKRRRAPLYSLRLWTALPRSYLNLDSTNLRGLNYESADLRKVSLVDACLRGAILPNALLDSTDFTGARLDSATLDNAQGMGTIFDKSRLEGASLNAAVLPGASFYAARLACATFDAAQLKGAAFPAARIEWAYFNQSDLSGVHDWVRIDPSGVTGAFVRTAALDSSQKAWSYRHGADANFVSPIDWTDAKEAQWSPNGACARSILEP